MSTIASITGLSAYATSTSELLDGAGTSSSSVLDQMSQVVEGTSSDTATDGSSDIVNLSQQAKTLLANARANKLADEKIDTFLQIGPGSAGAGTNATLNATPQSGATISTDATSQSQSFQPFVPTKTVSNTLTYDGYTLTLNADAGTQWYGIELNGNGVQAYSKHFGPSDSAAGGSVTEPGVEVASGTPGNNEAIDAIMVTRNSATASSASLSSSAGSAAASAVNAQSSSITFLVNYATGEISVEQSAASVSAQSTQVNSPGSTLSTVA